jgi:multiple sugar transport system ATP-binding protein
MATVETTDLSKTYRPGEPSAVANVDLAVADGETLAILGPAGSGKTTLLRMVAGFEQPTRGEVLIGGSRVTSLSAQQRRTALVSHAARASHLTVGDDLVFQLRSLGVPPDQHRARVKAVCGLLGIAHLASFRLPDLAPAEQQRMQLARVLVREPSVILLDDPLAKLAPSLQTSARGDFADLRGRLGTAAIYATSNPSEAMAIGDRVAVLQNGSIRQVGTPRQLYDEPADTFVAGLLGSHPMNLLVNGHAIVGFRSEDLLPSDAVGGPKVEFRFRVTSAGQSGDCQLLCGRLEGTHWEGQEVFSCCPGALPARFTPGSVGHFAVSELRLKFFDKSTEKRTAPSPVAWF